LEGSAKPSHWRPLTTDDFDSTWADLMSRFFIGLDAAFLGLVSGRRAQWETGRQRAGRRYPDVAEHDRNALGRRSVLGGRGPRITRLPPDGQNTP
jgi:hypothetical protein